MGIDYNGLAAVVGLVTAIIAVVALLQEGRRSRLALQTDLLLKLDEKFYGAEMRLVRKNAARKLLADQYPNRDSDDLLDYFNTIGILVERKALDIDLTYRIFEYRTTRYWHCAREHIEKERLKDPEFWSTLERLIGRLAMYRSKRGLTKINPTEEELGKFLHEESILQE